MARASTDNGVGYCKTYIERRFPAAQGTQREGNLAAGDRGARTARSDAGDTASMQALVDSGFQRWSRQWWTDRYVPDSTLIDQQQCTAAGCEVAGEFTVIRLGQSIQVPFTAKLAKRTDGFALSTLCYDDSASSGMRDCAR